MHKNVHHSIIIYSSKVVEATQMPNKKEVFQEITVLSGIHNYKIYLETRSNTENIWTQWLQSFQNIYIENLERNTQKWP